MLVSKMNWKILLKEIRMDKDVNCCEEARMKIIEWFEKHIDKVDTADMPRYTDFDRKSFKDSLITTSTALSEESCEDLYDSIQRFFENYNLEASTFFENRELEDIVNEWDKCREEPQKEENPAMDNFPLFQENPTDWMNQYIRGRN